MKKPKSMAEMKALATADRDDDLITVEARVTLTRAEWARSMHSVTIAGVCQAIGMSMVSTAEKVLAQVIATGKEARG